MTRKDFWSKPPLERSRIVAEHLSDIYFAILNGRTW